MSAPVANPFEEFIGRFYNDPVAFVVEVLDQDPEPWQAEALKAIARGERRISIRSGHGVGKSTFASWAAIWYACTRYTCKVVITAPTSSQLYDALFAELKAQLKKLPESLLELWDSKTDRIELKAAPQEVFISARTSRAEQPEAMQGVHADNVLLIADEASGVPEAVYEAAVGSMSGHAATTLLLGNPTQSSGLFYDTHHKLKDQWWTMKVSCLDVPRRVSAEFVKQVAQTYGEASNAYRVRVLGEFPLADDDTVIPIYLIEAAKMRDIAPNFTERIVWGLDVARFGSDRSVLTKRMGGTLMEPQQVKRNLETMEVVGWVVNEWNNCLPHLRPVEIMVDAIGLGAGVADRLRELQLPAVDINVSEAPAFGEKYRNLRSEIWFRGKAWFERRNTGLNHASEELINELAMVRYSFTSNGKLQVESKDEIKKRTRDHSSPDLADSFLLTFAGSEGVHIGASNAANSSWSKPVRRNFRRA